MTAASPLVSVVIPCYNQAPFLAEAIDSVLAQTYRLREVIVVDDGSTDHSAAVALSYGDRIRFIRQANAGPAVSRNRGIAASQGAVIGVLDGDDRWLPHKLEVEVPRFADPTIGIVHGSYRKFPPTHRSAGTIWKTSGGETGFHEILSFNAVGTPVSVLFRRSVFEEAGKFDETFRRPGAEDWDLWIRMAARSRIVGSGQLTAEYRLRENSTSQNYQRTYCYLRQVIEKNRGHHTDCAECRRALRRARHNARSYYFDSAARAAFRAKAAGHPIRYLVLRIHGLLRHPHAATRIVPGIIRRIKTRLA